MNKIEHIRKNTLIIIVATVLSILSVAALTQAVETTVVCMVPSDSCQNTTQEVPAQTVQGTQGTPSPVAPTVTPIPSDEPESVEAATTPAPGCYQ